MGVSIYEVAALSSGTGDVTPAIPTHGDADNWWLYLVVQTAAEFTTLSSGGHASDPKLGFVELVAARTSTGTPGAAGSVGLQLFRYQLNNAGTLGTAPTIADAGDHIIAFMFSARDHWTGGDPLDALATSVQATATTSATGPGVTTQVNDATLLCIIANATDTATTQGSSASNADLSFVGFEAHRQDVAGAGGGVEIIGGVDATAGTVGAFAMTLATSSATAAITISLAATSTPGVGGGGYTLAADPGSYALTGTTVGLKVTHRLVVEAGAYAVTGANVGLSTQTPVSALGLFAWEAIPALWWSRELSPPAWFSAEFADEPPTAGSYTLAADPGTYALTGTSVGLTASRLLTVEGGSYAATGSDVAFRRATTLAVDPGTYAVTGGAVGLVAARKLTAEAGSYALTGSDATLARRYALAVEAGAYSVTGAAAGLAASRVLAIGAGSYSATGSAVGLAVTHRVAVDQGSYATTGASVALRVAHRLAVEPGAYALTGTAANLARTVRLAIDAGAYDLTGTPVSLRVSHAVVAAAGAYAWGGGAVGLLVTRRAGVEAGAYELDGADVGLSVVASGPAIPLPDHLTLSADLGGAAFVVAASTGEAPFAVAPPVDVTFEVADPTAPGDLFAVAADSGAFAVTRSDLAFTITPAVDAAFTVEEV